MNNTATATAKETVRRPAPAAPSSAGRMTRSFCGPHVEERSVHGNPALHGGKRTGGLGRKLAQRRR